MTIEDIEERFMKIRNKSGIVAVYFYDERSNTDLDWVGIGKYSFNFLNYQQLHFNFIIYRR